MLSIYLNGRPHGDRVLNNKSVKQEEKTLASGVLIKKTFYAVAISLT
jgi:hypothetical protein